MTQIGDSAAQLTVSLPGGAGSRAVTLNWSFISDRGNRRAVNEDSVVANPPVFAIADGMGGHAAGDVASDAVVTRIGAITGSEFITTSQIEAALDAAVEDIDRVGDETTLGTGTTVTGLAMAIIDEEAQWVVFNIGDSRVYFFENDRLQQITVDHSVVQELVAAGLITRDEAETHPDSNVITRAVGFHERPVPDYSLLPIEPGQRILICSDGLTKELNETGIAHYLRIAPSPETAVGELVAAALANGGRDNVTVLVLDVEAPTTDALASPATRQRP